MVAALNPLTEEETISEADCQQNRFWITIALWKLWSTLWIQFPNTTSQNTYTQAAGQSHLSVLPSKETSVGTGRQFKSSFMLVPGKILKRDSTSLLLILCDTMWISYSITLVAAWKQNSGFKFSLSSSLPFSSLWFPKQRGWREAWGEGDREREILAHNGLSLFFNSSYFSGGGLVAKSCPTLATPRTISCQAPLSMWFSRQEYWSGLPFPSPGDLSDPRIEPRSPALRTDSLPTELQVKPHISVSTPFLFYACLEITQSTFSLPFKILHPIIISTPTPPDPEAAHIAKDGFLLWVRV